MQTCSICRKRPAFYLREYSGHRLCTLCIERVILKAVKRRINSTHLLSPGSTIAVPIYRYDPMGSLSMVRLLSLIEAKYGSKLLVLTPINNKNNKIIEQVINDVSTRISVDISYVEAPRPRIDSLVHCMRLERSWALREAPALGAHAIVDSVNRTQAILAALDALLNARMEGLSEVLPVVESSPPVIHGFYDVEAETVTAYAYSRGFVMEGACRAHSISKSVFLSVSRGRPELVFSGYKVLDRLAMRAGELVGGERCRVCGGLGGPVCIYCRENGAKLAGDTQSPPS